MNKNNIITSIIIGLMFSGAVSANDTCKTKEVCFLNEIVYLEQEADFDLGFDTADYLPEDFDPHSFYFNLNSVAFLELDELDEISTEYLPEDFNPYAAPSNFMDISYIDPNDLIEPVIEVRYEIPEEIDATISK